MPFHDSPRPAFLAHDRSLATPSMTRLRRRLYVTSALALAASLHIGVWDGTARAQEVTISGGRDTPISTGTADDGTPADIVVEDSGELVVPEDTAVTINSDNTVTNEGTIGSEGMSNARGILIDTGDDAAGTLESGLVQNGNISAGELDDDDNAGTNNAGILITGDGTFVGDIDSSDGSAISVIGDDSFGFSLDSAMTGDVTLDAVSVSGDNSRAVSISGTLDGNLLTIGTASASGSGSTALSIDGTVSGSAVNEGSLTSGSGVSYNSDGNRVDAVPGTATVHVGGRLETGFLNNLYYRDEDGNRSETADDDDVTYTTVTGSISANGGAPAILVSPTGAGDAYIGQYGSGGDGYAIINEGDISSAGQNPETDVSAILIEGATVDGTGYRAILEGGLSNRSTGSISATAVDATARGIEVGQGGVVPTIRNAGTIEVETGQTVDGDDNTGPGGDAIAILVGEGGSVDSIANSGAIAVGAAGDDSSAYGIIDRSGTLQSISNSGEILVEIAEDGNGRTVAIDVSRNHNGVAVSNSGEISGDMLFGNGDDSLSFSGGTAAGAISFGEGQDSFSLSGDSSFTGTILSENGDLGLSMSGSSTLDFTGQESLELRSLDLTGSAQLVVPASIDNTSIAVSGAANIGSDATLAPVFTNIIVDEGTVTLVSADSLVIDNPGKVITGAELPYFYNIEDTVIDDQELSLVLRRKSASELGLSNASATLYENSITALNSDAALANAVGNVKTAEDFALAYRQMEPPSYGSAIASAAITTQNLAFGFLSNRMDSLRDTRRYGNSTRATDGIWVQEAASFYDKTETDNDPGFDGHTFAVALGADKPLFGLDAVGIGFTQSWTSLDKDLLTGRPLRTTHSQFDLYASWSKDGFFTHATVAGAYNTYESSRTLTIGDFERTATADWNGTQFSGNLRAGYEIPLGAFLLIPSNSISYINLRQSSYQEEDGGGMNLDVDSSSFSSLRNSARLALAYYNRLGDRSAIKMQLHGGWIRNLDKSGVSTTARFAAGGDSFTLETDPLASDTLTVGANIAYVSDETTLSLAYDFGSADQLDTHTASVTWYMRF